MAQATGVGAVVLGRQVDRNDQTNPSGIPHIKIGAATGGVLIAVLVGILLDVGGFTGYYGEGLSYFSTDPAACTNCHIMRPQFAYS